MAITTEYGTPVGTSHAGKAMKTATDQIALHKTNLEQFTALTEMDEVTMIKYNLAASQYSTMVSMSSGLVKSLSDTEKQVANKM